MFRGDAQIHIVQHHPEARDISLCQKKTRGVANLATPRVLRVYKLWIILP